MQAKISEYFRLARLAAGLSIKDVASGNDTVTEDDLRGLEDGAALPPLESIYTLVNAYNLDPDSFIELLYVNDFKLFETFTSTALKNAKD